MIFIVDDDPSVRTSLTRLLRSVDYEAQAFGNSAEFLDGLDAAGQNVACVILDVRMPGMSGVALQEVINRRAPQVPVIVLTATDDADLLAMAATAGVASVFRKPCEAEVLLRAVAAAIAPDRPSTHTRHPEEFGSSRTGLGDPANFVLEERRGLYRPVGSVSFDEAVALVRAAIATARRNQVRHLLVNTTALTGFPSPDTFERFLAAVAWAEESSASVHLAVVARAEMIHPQKFGVRVAANRGLVANIFTSEVEACAWLDLVE